MKKTVFILLFSSVLGFSQNTIDEVNTETSNGLVEHGDYSIVAIETIPEFEACNSVDKSEKMSCFQLELNKHIKKHFTYPQEALDNNIQGRVTVSFLINKEGDVTNIVAGGNVDQILKNEAIRIFKLLPKFKPGTQRGKPVTVKYAMPLSFRMQ